MSTGRDGPTSDDDPLGVERFAELNREYQQQIDRIPDRPESQKDRMEVTHDFLADIASIEGAGHMVEEQAVEIAAEKTDRTKKATTRDLKQLKRQQKERKKRDRPEITELLFDDVETLEALASSETDGDVRFRFVLDHGGSVVVDRDTLYSATGTRRAFALEYKRLPVFDSERWEAWSDVVDELFDDLLEVKTDAVGPRQVVISKVQDLVEKHAAYTDIDRAYATSGVFVETADSDVVYVESSRIEERAAEKDESLEAIRWEFDDRGLRVGPSERRRVQGKRKTWWGLTREYFEPKRIEHVESRDDQEDDADQEDVSDGGADE